MRHIVFQWEKWIKAAIISCVFLKCCTCEIVLQNVSYFLWCEMFFFSWKIWKWWFVRVVRQNQTIFKWLFLKANNKTIMKWNTESLEAIHRCTLTAVVYKRVTFIVTKTQQERTKAATVFCLVDFSHTKRQLLLSIHKVACCFCTV